MQLVNRSGWLVVPKQPYADWVNGLPVSVSELEQPMSLTEHQAESRFYMVDEPTSTDESEGAVSAEPLAVLPESWASIFENELSGWDPFADHWPPVEPQRFQAWFELRPVALVFDAGKAALMRASLE